MYYADDLHEVTRQLQKFKASRPEKRMDKADPETTGPPRPTPTFLNDTPRREMARDPEDTIPWAQVGPGNGAGGGPHLHTHVHLGGVLAEARISPRHHHHHHHHHHTPTLPAPCPMPPHSIPQFCHGVHPPPQATTGCPPPPSTGCQGTGSQIFLLGHHDVFVDDAIRLDPGSDSDPCC